MLDVAELIVNTNISVAVHPAVFVVTLLYVPLKVYVLPLAPQVYESHAVIDVLVEVLLLIVNTNVSVNVHPAALVVTFVYVPPVVYVVPFADHV